jgi:hypothetical protein
MLSHSLELDRWSKLTGDGARSRQTSHAIKGTGNHAQLELGNQDALSKWTHGSYPWFSSQILLLTARAVSGV